MSSGRRPAHSLTRMPDEYISDSMVLYFKSVMFSRSCLTSSIDMTSGSINGAGIRRIGGKNLSGMQHLKKEMIAVMMIFYVAIATGFVRI